MKETSELITNNLNGQNSEMYTVSNLVPIQKPKISPANDNNIYDYLYFIVATVLYCIVACLQSSISPITDVLQSELNVNLSNIGLLSALYFVTYLLFQIPSGLLLQHYSYRLLLLIISIGLSISVLLFGFINSFILASILRTIGGIFSSPSWITNITVIGQNFGNNKVSLFAGITILFAFGSNLCFIGLQGYLYEKYKIWRSLFYGLGIIGILTVISLIFCILFDNVSNGANKSWIMALSFSNLSQKKLKKLDGMHHISGTLNKMKQTMQNYLNWVVGLIGFCFFTIQSSVFGLWLIPYLMLKLSYSRSYASFLSGLCLLCEGIGGLIFGYISTKLNKRKIILIIGIFCCYPVLLLIYLEPQYIDDLLVIIICISTGIGVGANCILFTLVREYNMIYDIEETATGFMNAIMTSSGLISQYLIGCLIDYHWDIRNKYNETAINQFIIRQYDVTDYNFAFSCVLPIVSLLAFIMSLILKETNGKI